MFFKGRFFILLARVFLFSLFIVKNVLSSFPIYSSNLTFSCLAFYLAVFLFNFFSLTFIFSKRYQQEKS
jgi:hypothetical protein